MPQAAIQPSVIDHCVLPTAELSVARARLLALGFTVAPEGVHPFGTKNACVYLADDTFLEPLALADADEADAAVSAGNVFIARDRAFRASNGVEGFSAIVLGSESADDDHARFVAAGVSAGPRLDFSRRYIDAEGAARTVSFRLAFAAPVASSDAFFFTCERIDARAGGRGALASHDNGVVGLSRLVAVAEDPVSFAPFFTAFTGCRGREIDDGLLVETTRAPISVLDSASFEQRFGKLPGQSIGLRLSAIVFSVTSLGVVKAVFARSGIGFEVIQDRIVVPPAPGQGAIFAFEENQ